MAMEDIRKGEFVIEYVGDLIDENECRQRIEQMHKDNIDDFYFLSLDQNRLLTAYTIIIQTFLLKYCKK